MPIVSSYDSEQWPMFLRVNRRRRRAISSKSGGIRCVAGCNSIRRREVSRRSHAGNMRHGNWTMPLWLSISPTIPTPRWRNWGKCLRSVSWRFGKPDKACGLLEKKRCCTPNEMSPPVLSFKMSWPTWIQTNSSILTKVRWMKRASPLCSCATRPKGEGRRLWHQSSADQPHRRPS